jgi:tetratricopeptide (TPR) repeat protein/tRNA A-37 threonylcarbamoyl transferase component Bud32
MSFWPRPVPIHTLDAHVLHVPPRLPHAMPLREELEKALGAAYRLERELGGGGMSRVFVAEEKSLGRRVVVKVLPPEIAAGVNVDRFRREIQMAARLQHPHIVPVLSSGEMDGIPFYTMPFVEGESARARLQRAGALSITEVIGILRDVAKALAYAHDHGIVHRDIKPDNVLLSGGSATVADFGIAKAIAAARTEGESAHATLTQIGSSIGTPAYMAPEQAAADPSTNHRADIYSFGCMAYELLAGRPPFMAKTPQRLLAAQMGETPEPITGLRLDTPPALAELVMRCLEKDADNRPQHASNIVTVLETVTSGGTHAPMPAILLGGKGMLGKALLAYAVAFGFVAILAKAAIVAIGLPDWVFPGALIVMALGLPVILFTGYVYHVSRRAVTMTPTFTPGGTPSQAGTLATLAVKASPHMSWKRTWVGGAYALGGFVLLIGMYMTLRALGIGPFGSLMAAGTLQRDERLLVADFTPPARDSSLGPVITDAFRTALGQSRSITVMQPQQVADALRRMQRPTRTAIDFTVGREIATREGVRGVIVGDIISLGGNYAIAVRLVSPTTGDELAAFRETAASERELLGAIDKLARNLRSRIGESLRNVQSTRAFEQVTTPSLEALKKYVQGSLALSLDGDFTKGSGLLEQAIALDTGFAMAYRKLAIEYQNRGQLDRSIAMMDKAFQHRERMTDVERYLLMAGYYQGGSRQDIAKSIENYEAAIELQPNLVAAINNVANDYRVQRNFARAEEMYLRAIRTGNPPAVSFSNLVSLSMTLGKRDQAYATMAAFDSAYPTNPGTKTSRITVTYLVGRYDSAEAIATSQFQSRENDLPVRATVANQLATITRIQGRIRESARWRDDVEATNIRRGFLQAHLARAAGTAFDRLWFFNDRSGIAVLDRALLQTPLERLPHSARPYVALASVYGMAGQPEKARRILAAFRRATETVTLISDPGNAAQLEGHVALSEKRYADAIRHFRAADIGTCITCALPQLAAAYDLAGQSDSSIAIMERFFATPDGYRGGPEAQWRPWMLKRLGELYEAKNDRENALSNYLGFVELWKNADPELQPRVAEVRRRIVRLSDTERR